MRPAKANAETAPEIQNGRPRGCTPVVKNYRWTSSPSFLRRSLKDDGRFQPPTHCVRLPHILHLPPFPCALLSILNQAESCLVPPLIPSPCLPLPPPNLPLSSHHLCFALALLSCRPSTQEANRNKQPSSFSKTRTCEKFIQRRTNFQEAKESQKLPSPRTPRE